MFFFDAPKNILVCPAYDKIYSFNRLILMKIETSAIFTHLSQLPIGARLIVQSKNDWRAAVVSSISEERVVLIITSPSGRNYRKICLAETAVEFDGKIPILGQGTWRENFVKYDFRW
jgi:hypothetical protein